MPGILMSRKTRSGVSRSATVRPSWPDPAVKDLVALVLENHPHRVADGRLVVDDENPGLHDSGSGTTVR